MQDSIEKIVSEFVRIESNLSVQERASDSSVELFGEELKRSLENGELVLGEQMRREIGNRQHIAPLAEAYSLEKGGDSYGAIFHADEQGVQVMKRGSKVGHNVSMIRPEGFPVKGSSVKASGLIPFIDRYVRSMVEVRGGKMELSVHVNHADIFAIMRKALGVISRSGGRLALIMDDEFMRSAQEGRPYRLGVDSGRGGEERADANDNGYRVIDAKSLLEEVAQYASLNGNLDVIFVRDFLPQKTFVDGCLLGEYDGVCRVGIDLYSCVQSAGTPLARIDWEKLSRLVKLGVRVSDDALELEREKMNLILTKLQTDPETSEIKKTEIELWNRVKTTLETGRRMSVSLKNVDRMLAALGGVNPDVVEKVYRHAYLAAYGMSVDLAGERGACAAFDFKSELGRADTPANRMMKEDAVLANRMITTGRRNIAIMCAPEDVMDNSGVNVKERIRLTARMQKWTDNVVSVSIFPMTDTVENGSLSQLILQAWNGGCMGVRIERNKDADEQSIDEYGMSIAELNASSRPTDRPTELECDVVWFQNNREKWIAFVGLLDGQPYEIFTGLADEEDGLVVPKSVTHGRIIKSHQSDGRSRYDFQWINSKGYKTTIEGLNQKFDHEYWNYAKLISGVLRYGMPIDQVIHLVGGLQLSGDSINNWKVGVARALKKYSELS